MWVCVGVSVCVCFNQQNISDPNHKMPNDNNKRRRQNNDKDETSPAPPKRETPTSIAGAAIDTFVESLREEVRPTFQRKAKAYLAKLATAAAKFATRQRMMDDESFIPRSARINFSVKTNKSTAETDEFKQLSEQTDELVAQMKRDL